MMGYSAPTVPQYTSSLSRRNYKSVLLVSTLVYTISYAALGYNYYYSSNPLCPLELSHASWVRDMNLSAAGSLLVTIGLQLNRVFLSTFRDDGDVGTLSSYYASILVNGISSSAHFGAVLFNWGGTCTDPFGVHFPAGIWPEWVVSVPLLVFIALSVDDKPSLDQQDWLFVGMTVAAMVCGAILQVTTSPFIGHCLLAACSLLMTPLFYIAWKSDRQLQRLRQKATGSDKKRALYQRRILVASRRLSLARCIITLFPMFPIIYTLRRIHWISDDVFTVAIMYASAFAKLAFAALCMDAHLEVSHPAVALFDAEKFANTSRRAFLRYVFHEVRVPLNAVSLGIQILENAATLQPEERETVQMVKEAVSCMGDTLNDVMALQKVEEGSMELMMKSFSVMELLENIQVSFADMLQEHGVRLVVQVDTGEVPAYIIGDRFRIRHVLVNIISNAVRHSPLGGTITFRISVDHDNVLNEDPSSPTAALLHNHHPHVTLLFVIRDEGRGIFPSASSSTSSTSSATASDSTDSTGSSAADFLDQDDVFTPFRSLQDGDVVPGRSTGLSLAISKEMVRMHNGKIWVESPPGQGACFFVAIPFAISSTSSSPNSTKANSPHHPNSISNHTHWKTIYQQFRTQYPHYSAVEAMAVGTGSMAASSSAIASLIQTPTLRANLSPEVTLPPISTSTNTRSSAVVAMTTMAMDETMTGLRRRSPRLSVTQSTTATHITMQPHVQESILMRKYARDTDSVLTNESSVHDEDEEGTSLLRGERVSTHRSISHTRSPGGASRRRSAATALGPSLSLQHPDPVGPTVVAHHDESLSSATRWVDTSVPASMAPVSVSTAAIEQAAAIYQHYSVLIVDDVLSNRKLLAMLLSKKGIQNITFANDGVQAVNTVVASRSSSPVAGASSSDSPLLSCFDLIFMDNTMPLLSGIEATRRIRSLGHRQ
eukprot:gene7235-5208_t